MEKGVFKMSRTNNLILDQIFELTIKKFSYGTPEYELYKKGFGVLTGDDTELSFPFNNFYKERIKEGIPALFNYLMSKEYDIWLYGEDYPFVYVEKSPITEIYDDYISESEISSVIKHDIDFYVPSSFHQKNYEELNHQSLLLLNP